MTRTRTKTFQQPLNRERLLAVAIFLFAMGLLFVFSVRATDIGTNVTVTGDVYATSTVQATHYMISYRNLLVGTTTATNQLNFGAQFATSTYFQGFVGIGDATDLGDNNLKVEGDIYASSTIQAGSTIRGYSGLLVRASTTFSDLLQVSTLSASSTARFTGLLGQASSTFSDLLMANNFSASSTARLTGLLSTASSTVGNDFMVSDDFSNGPTTTFDGFRVQQARSLFSAGGDATTTISVVTQSSTKGGCIEMRDGAGAMFHMYIHSTTASSSLLLASGTC